MIGAEVSYTVQVTRTYTTTEYAEVETCASSPEEAADLVAVLMDNPTEAFWLNWDALDSEHTDIAYDLGDVTEGSSNHWNPSTIPPALIAERKPAASAPTLF